MLLTNVPIEIFEDIGCYLNQEELATCQAVCKSWYKRWSAFNYYSIHTRERLQFQNFFQHTLKQSIYPPGTIFSVGHQVRKLVIENGHIEPSVLGQLPLLCPYLEVFMFDGVILSQEARREQFQYYQQRKNREELDKTRHHFANWKNMRQIVEFGGITVAHSLLKNVDQDGCSSLTHISVQFNNSNDRTNSKASFIDSLANAPLLESLSIEQIYLLVTELEKIHSNCSKLFSLRLINTVLLPMAEEFDMEGIMPAGSLYDLQLVDGSFYDDVSRWLDYISRKYIHVKNFDIGSCSFTSEGEGKSEISPHHYQHQLSQIARRFTKLEALKLLPFSLGKSFFVNLDERGTYLTNFTLGDGLNTASLSNDLSALIQSQQTHSITALTIHGWPLSTNMNGTVLIMETLYQCANLTTLHLSMGRYLHQKSHAAALANNPANNNFVDNGTLYFDFILEQCPKLVSLSITDAKLITMNDIDANIGGIAFYAPPHKNTAYPLQSLTLDNVLFETDSVFNIIASNCRTLDQLSLTSTVPNPEHLNNRQLKIHLPQHRLKTLVLDRIRVSRKCSIRLGTSRFKISRMMSGKKTVWYDLVGYECCMSHFSASPPAATTARGNNGNSRTSNNRNRHQYYPSSFSPVVCSNVSMILSGRMRARKVKTHVVDGDHTLDYNLDQSVYVAVACKDVGSIYLTGLQVL